MRRATTGGPILLFTFDRRPVRDLWLNDYFPDIGQGDEDLFPAIGSVAAMVEEDTGLVSKILEFPLPPDLTDLFLAAGWHVRTFTLMRKFELEFPLLLSPIRPKLGPACTGCKMIWLPASGSSGTVTSSARRATRPDIAF
jgi:hypothetical protein